MTKIGLYLCECGPNIANAINLDEIAEQIKKDGKVAGIERHKLLCSDDGKKFLAETIKKNEFERIVIAACSPKQHEGTFMEVMKNANLNPYMFQLVNIREQCAWTTPDKDAATRKALRTLRAAINRVKHHAPLETKEIECNSDVIIIGSSITSLETALRTAQRNRKVYLIAEDALSNSLKNYGMLLPSMKSTEEFFKTKIEEIKKNKQIEVFENSKIKEILGFFGNFVATIQTKENKDVQLNAGSVVLAIDAQSYVPKGLDKFGYEKFDDVYTAHQFAQMSADKIKTKSDVPPKSIAIIHCVGRKKLGYCSKACCVNSMKIARYIKNQLDETSVTQFYKNLCLPEKRYDNYYKETKEKGVEFIRYKDIQVARENAKLVIKYKNENDKEDKQSVDIIILSTGLVPDPRVEKYSHMFNIPTDEYGFLKEEHTKLGPISTTTEGVFVAGGMHGPGEINDSMTQAAAAAGKILSSLVPGRRLQLETKTSNVSEAMCVGCGVCVTICTYGAVKIDEFKHISVVNEVLCRGCGNCAAACPSGAARHRHFTTKQITQEIMEMLK
jgi:heterodisulfide reductase subunit A